MRFNSKTIYLIPITQLSTLPPKNVFYIYLNFIAFTMRARLASVVEFVPFPYVGPSVVVGTEDDPESVGDPDGSLVVDPVPLGPSLVTLGLPVVDEPPSTLPVVDGAGEEGEEVPEPEVLGAEVPDTEGEDVVLGVEGSLEPEGEPVALGDEEMEPVEPIADAVAEPVVETEPVAEPVPDAEPVADPVGEEVVDVVVLVESTGALCMVTGLHPLIIPTLPPRTFPSPQL